MSDEEELMTWLNDKASTQGLRFRTSAYERRDVIIMLKKAREIRSVNGDPDILLKKILHKSITQKLMSRTIDIVRLFSLTNLTYGA